MKSKKIMEKETKSKIDLETIKKAIETSNIDVIVDNIEQIAIENENIVSKAKIDLNKKETFNNFYDLLKGNLESEILSSNTSEIADLSKDVKKYMNRQLGYLGFVFYVWNPKNLNIKIIPLTKINPILDLTNVKEFYFLYRPAMFIDGKPVFLVIRGIPLSFELKLLKDDSNMVKQIELDGYSASEVRALLRSGFTTYLFGKPNMSLTQMLYFIFLVISIMLVEYIVLSTIFMVI